MRHYKIAELLANGEQPFDRLDDETYGALRRGVGNGEGGLTVPIVLSARGRLLDGHHRLKALEANGRKTISEADVRIDKSATDDESEALAAIGYQRVRRQTTTADNAKVARGLMSRFGWSQGIVAKRMGVSAAAVSQWLSNHPDPDFDVTTRTGVDGKTYTVEPGPEPKGRKPKHVPTPDETIADYAASFANPGWLEWVTGWARMASEVERKPVVADLLTIAHAFEALAESVAGREHPGTEGDF